MMNLLERLRRLVVPKNWEPPADLQEARRRLDEVQRRLNINADELDIALRTGGKGE